MTATPCESTDLPLRRGAVAVIVREGKLLVIRRSQHVRAPGMFCFPGGGIESGETEEMALVRELKEELNLAVQPTRRLWENVTPWRVHLVWWQAEIEAEVSITPNPLEVAEVHWFTTSELRLQDDLLPSNLAFLDALAAGEIPLKVND